MTAADAVAPWNARGGAARLRFPRARGRRDEPPRAAHARTDRLHRRRGRDAAFWWTQHGGDAGAVNGFIDTVAHPAGLLFLKFLKMLVLPLMFSALIVGITEIGDIASLGRVGLRMLFYIVVVTSIAIVVGLCVINLVQPGVGFDPAIRDGLLAAHSADAQAITAAKPSLSGVKIVLGLVPDNPIKAAADGGFLAVMFFAVMLGIALVLRPTPATGAFKATVQGLLELVMKLMELVIRLTPYAVAALMFTLTKGDTDLDI